MMTSVAYGIPSSSPPARCVCCAQKALPAIIEHGDLPKPEPGDTMYKWLQKEQESFECAFDEAFQVRNLRECHSPYSYVYPFRNPCVCACVCVCVRVLHLNALI